LFGNDNIHNEAHYVASNIPIILMLNLFIALIYISPSVARKRFLNREGAKARKHKIAETVFEQGGGQSQKT